MNIIEFDAVDHAFRHPDQPAQSGTLLEGITASVEQGAFVVLLGDTSATSAFLRLCNGLLMPTAGVVRVCGMDTRDQTRLWELRRLAGMMFADTDSQIIGATVAEDVAFGPENLGLAPRHIQSRVRDALQVVGMDKHGDEATHLLTQAQKLRVALAGVLAMQPKCLLLENVFATLDPTARSEFLELLHGLHRGLGITVVQAANAIEEAVMADRVMLFRAAKMAFAGALSPLLAGHAWPGLPGLARTALCSGQNAAGAVARC